MDNNCKSIHETSLGHLIDIWDSIKDVKDEIHGEITKKGGSPMQSRLGMTSIAKAASNLTMVFPVICSRNISVESQRMIVKALEKNDVSMLQRLFASWQVADGGISNVQDYISAFHKNLSSGTASMDDVFRIMDKVSEGALSTTQKNAIREDMRNINFTLPDSISENSLMHFSVNNEGVVREDNTSSTTSSSNDADRTNTITPSKNKNNVKKMSQKEVAEYFGKQVVDSDYKKANELIPTTMVVNFCINDPNKDTLLPYDSALVAVKAKLYPISSEDIVNHVSDKTMERNWITNFFRASTREISFMKDFVLALDKAKIDALSLSDRKRTSDKMWKVLERRALTARIKRSMLRNDTASVAAITTLVVSQEEVEYMRKYNHVDLESVSTVLNLFTALNLMCVVIVDESLEVAKFIYDEQDPMWETISFNHLEREASDNAYKKVVNLMTKVSR